MIRSIGREHLYRRAPTLFAPDQGALYTMVNRSDALGMLLAAAALVPCSQSQFMILTPERVGENWCRAVPGSAGRCQLVESGEIGNVGYNPCSSVQDHNRLCAVFFRRGLNSLIVSGVLDCNTVPVNHIAAYCNLTSIQGQNLVLAVKPFCMWPQA